jgi:hypothetical protein
LRVGALAGESQRCDGGTNPKGSVDKNVEASSGHGPRFLIHDTSNASEKEDSKANVPQLSDAM